MAAPTSQATYLPTKKWFAALFSGVSAIVISGIESGGFDAAETGAAKILAVSLFAAYVKKNDALLA